MDAKVQSKLEKFFSTYKKQLYKKGEILIRADDNPSEIFFLISGNVKQYSISANGDEQMLTVYKPLTFFPLSWAISNIPNKYYFEAISECEVIKAPKSDVIKFVKDDSLILYDLVNRLFKGMHGLLSRIEYLLSGNAYELVIFTILNTATRFGEKDVQTNEVILHTTHKEIAAISGLTKETISRESQKLQKKGLIENKNHLIRIRNIKDLTRELQS